MNKKLSRFLTTDFSLDIDIELKQKFEYEYKESIKKINLKDNKIINNEIYFNKCINIIHKFSQKPWITQSHIANFLDLNKKELIILNSIIKSSEFFQKIILKEGVGNKYWNTIIPFAQKTDKVIDNIYEFPMRIAIFPGVSCMFYCGFCGRNQKEKYPLGIVENAVKTYKKLFSETSGNTAFSISGGLEPLTNPKLGEIITAAYKKNIKIPLITNGYSLTQNYIKNNPGIWNLDSLRISLYGVDTESYNFITRVNKSYDMVKKNSINFLKLRNLNNPNLKFGFNFIIVPENIDQVLKILDLIEEINCKVDNGKGVDFLTLRDDYQSITGNDEKFDTERKYRLNSVMSDRLRMDLIKIIQEFHKKKNRVLPNLHIDFGYSLESISQGVLDDRLIKEPGKNLRKYGFTQLSIAIDLYGDVFLFREAGFLNRAGNEKMIIGRISPKKSLENILKTFLEKKLPISLENEDSRFLDSFDHVLNILVNQAEKDRDFGIPFSLGPVKSRSIKHNMMIGNNWYSDELF